MSARAAGDALKKTPQSGHVAEGFPASTAARIDSKFQMLATSTCEFGLDENSASIPARNCVRNWAGVVAPKQMSPPPSRTVTYAGCEAPTVAIWPASPDM